MSSQCHVSSKILFDIAFSGCRDPRSAEYQAGVIAALEYLCGEVVSIGCAYPLGTCQADAFIAGTREGFDIFRAFKEEKGEVLYG